MGSVTFGTLYWLVLEGASFNPATAIIGAALIAGYYIYDYYYGGGNGSGGECSPGTPCE